MNPLKTVKIRYIISFISNGATSVIFFLIGILLARYLEPKGYGEYQFLLGIFLSTYGFIDVGTSSAFYTFISQSKKSLKFYFSYFIWAILQGILPIVIIAFSNTKIVSFLFVIGDKQKLILAATATFISTNIKNIISNISESQRYTAFSQGLSVIFSIIHLVFIIYFINFGLLTINYLFIILICEYIIYAIIGIYFLFFNKKIFISKDNITLKGYFHKYYEFCKPLFIYSIFSSYFMFFDRWILQKYGGSRQQAFFGVSRQFGRISFLAAASLMKIYWKEIAEAMKKNNLKRVEYIFMTVSKFLFIFTAGISIFLIPYSKEFLIFFYGKAYSSASLPFAIMLIFPIHQTLGQIYGGFFFASENTSVYSKAAIFISLIGMFISIILIGPFKYHCFNLGALGLSIKQIIINIISVNALGYIIGKKYDWNNLILFQIKILSILFVSSFLLYYLVSFISSNIAVKILISSIIYFTILGYYSYKKYYSKKVSL